MIKIKKKNELCFNLYMTRGGPEIFHSLKQAIDDKHACSIGVKL